MPLFPNAHQPEHVPDDAKIDPKFSNSIPNNATGKLFIGFIRTAHEVIRAVVSGDRAKVDETTGKLESLIAGLDLSDRDVRVTLMSIVMTLAATVSPTLYGGDPNLGGKN